MKKEHSTTIINVLESYRGGSQTLSSIRSHLAEKHPDSNLPSISTIGRHLKNDLKYRWKQGSVEDYKDFTEDHLWRIKGAFMGQTQLLREGKKLIYVDEFSLNLNVRKMR